MDEDQDKQITLFGHKATLTLDIDGVPFNATRYIEIEGATTGRGIFIDPGRLIRAIEVEREVRSRVERGMAHG